PSTLAGGLAQEERAELAQRRRAYAAYARELALSGWVLARHLAQSDVREHHVRRDISLVGQAPAEGAQPLEQRFVAFEPHAGGLRRGLNGLGKHHPAPAGEHGAALIGHLEDVEAFLVP